MKLAGVVLSLVMLAGIGVSEDAKPVSESTQNKILKAQHDFDDLVGQEKDQQLKFNQALATAEDIKKTYPELDKRTVAASKAVEEVETAAVKEAGLDPVKFVFDLKTMTIVPNSDGSSYTLSGKEISGCSRGNWGWSPRADGHYLPIHPECFWVGTIHQPLPKELEPYKNFWDNPELRMSWWDKLWN